MNTKEVYPRLDSMDNLIVYLYIFKFLNEKVFENNNKKRQSHFSYILHLLINVTQLHLHNNYFASMSYIAYIFLYV